MGHGTIHACEYNLNLGTMPGAYTNCTHPRARGSNTATVNEQKLGSSGQERAGEARRRGGLVRCVTTKVGTNTAIISDVPMTGKNFKFIDSKHKISTVLVLVLLQWEWGGIDSFPSLSPLVFWGDSCQTVVDGRCNVWGE
jgi:hypothetical protein